MKISTDIRRVSGFLALVLALAPVALFAANASVPTLSFGDPVMSGNTVTVPVYLDLAGATDISAWSISVRAPKDALSAITIQRAADSPVVPQFETTARNSETVTYIAWSTDGSSAPMLHVVDIQVPADHVRGLHIELDQQMTTVSDKSGQRARTAVNGELKLDGGIDVDRPRDRQRAK